MSESRSVSNLPAINSFNEWDPLEEVIVGVLGGMANVAFEIPHYSRYMPEWYDLREATMTEAGTPLIPSEAAVRELEGFVHVLEAEGVTVRRPDPVDLCRPMATPDWSVPAGWAQSVPRDLLVVIGNEIIEAPMSLRSRFFEYTGYRTLLNEYFRKGAKWTAVPKPRMRNSLYRNLYKEERKPGNWTLTEEEPVFDAADIARCGKDIFIQVSHVTNQGGVEWLRRHLGSTYRVHPVETLDSRAIHIDAQFLPVAPGKILVNPDRPLKQLPDCFKNKSWDLLEVPRTSVRRDPPMDWIQEWLHMNVLMLDEQRMVVERSEEAMIRKVKDWGFKPIPVAFQNVYRYGGSFHCFTCDVRRRGTLQSYF